MRCSSLLLLSSLLAPLAVGAQTPAPAAKPCAVLAAVTPSEADRAFAAGDSAKAEELYAAAIATAPSAAAYVGLVKSQIDRNEVAEALATAQKAAAALPASADAQALVGLALIRSGQIPEAKEALVKAYGLDHCSAKTFFGLSRLNDLMSRHLTASHELANAHQIAPHDAEITAAWIASLPIGPTPADDTHTPTLHAFLATNPALPPTVLEQLQTQLAILEAHALCTPVETAKGPVTLTLNGLMLAGTHPRSWGLKARLNSADLPLLDLDSSVSGIVLNPKDAKSAGVHPIGPAPVSASAPYHAIADKVSIGALTYRSCPVLVVPAPMLANSNSLIGTDFFRDHVINIDYVNRRVVLTPYPESTGGLYDRVVPATEHDWTTMYVAGSNILVPTAVNKKGPYLFLLDTGAYVTILSPDVNKKALLAMRDFDSNIHGYSGTIIKTIPKYGGSEMEVNNPEVKGPDGKFLKVNAPLKVPILSFTTNDFLDDHALAFSLTPKSHDTGVELGGLLGFSTLREFYTDIDYRNGLIRIQFDQKRLYMTRETTGGRVVD